ncbi:MAG: transcription termination factor Rho, partial [Verrucomicrobiota bacterium]
MITLVLTGGVASGKSTLSQRLAEAVEGVVLFDSDEEVSKLLRTEWVIEQIGNSLGPQVIDGDTVDKAALRELIFSEDDARSRLEEVLHPLVRSRYGNEYRNALREGASVFLAEIPLFFEGRAKWGQNAVIAASCEPDDQLKRLQERSGISPELAEQIINSQMTVHEKADRADHVFWTSGSEAFLMEQLEVFCGTLKEWVAADLEKLGPRPSFEIPETASLAELREKPLSELLLMAKELKVRGIGGEKGQLVFDVFQKLADFGSDLVGEGVVEKTKDSFGMIREPRRSFRPSPDDVYLGAGAMNEFGIRSGHLVKARVRAPRGRDNYLSVNELIEIEGIELSDFETSPEFDDLTSEFPLERFHLETEEESDLAVRLVDLIAPLGKGQRGLIVAPPRGGKTILLKQIARAIQSNHPETELIVLLLDERPEEVTDFEDTVEAKVYSSTFDETSKRHAQVSDLVLERAKRLVEGGKDVVILLDSLTRLARGYNNAASGGPIGSGGMNPNALAKARKFFGAARNVSEGGSLTILATCLIETDNRMDDVIFEELKGTGNMEIRLDRDLAERRVFPAIHIPQSGTRNDDRLYHPEELPRVVEIRRFLASMPVGEAIETLMKQLKATRTNAEFLMKGLR